MTISQNRIVSGKKTNNYLGEMTYAAAQALVAAGGVPDYSTVRITDRGYSVYYALSGAMYSQEAAAAAYTKFLLPCNQSGNNTVLPVDYSGNLATTQFGGSVGTSEPWANAGFLTIAAGAGHYARVANANSAFNLDTDSFIFIATIKKALPAGNEAIFGNSDGAAGNYGIYFFARSTGKMSISINADSTYGAALITTATVIDNTEHQVIFCGDATTKKLTTYVDGAADGASSTGAWAATTNKTIGAQFYIGQAISGLGVDLQTKGLQLLVFPNSGLPINVDDIAKQANLNRRVPVWRAQPVFF